MCKCRSSTQLLGFHTGSFFFKNREVLFSWRIVDVLGVRNPCFRFYKMLSKPLRSMCRSFPLLKGPESNDIGIFFYSDTNESLMEASRKRQMLLYSPQTKNT